MRNFSQQIFEERYGRPAVEEWHLQWHDDFMKLATPDPKTHKSRYPDILSMQGEGRGLICCPEDQICRRTCPIDKRLCLECRIPICADCRFCLTKNQLSPMSLVNDNFVGYLDPWIYEHDITWMEKTVATPFWTGMTLFSIDRKATHRRQKHNLLDTIYEGRGRVLFKGQLFSAPMDWPGLLEQLERAAQEEPLIALPVQGAILAARVRVTIAAGLVDLNKLLRQATVRRNVVEQLIRMRKDAGHPDYQHVNMEEVHRRTRQLATTDEPEIPSGLVEFLNAEDEIAEEFFSGVDKAATPAERAYTTSDLHRNLDRTRPQNLVLQRDSDAQRNILEGRGNALSQFSTLSLQTGANLIPQFKNDYIPRVFCTTLPRVAGGPDFPGETNRRRHYEDSPQVTLDTYTTMMASRCEYQIRADWDFNPGLFSLAFASRVNMSQSMAIKRALRRGAGEENSDASIGAAAQRIYQLLQEGEYADVTGRRFPVRGDISKITRIIGLSNTEKALLQNFHFMSSRLPGTRQVRNSIRHIIFSSRIFYGAPVFMTLTPSERHSGLAIRLYRGRASDPAFESAAQDLRPWIGAQSPSLCPPDNITHADEVQEVDLPDYDTRRLITSRDPLCCVHAFKVMTRVVLPTIHGLRMCPKCPHCATATNPCMDSFGSNATPMGGAAGRCDAMVAAVESQAADGVLHVHLFMYFQMAMQLMTLHQLAQHLREKMLTADALKQYVNHVRCASYPDIEAHQASRSQVEKAWPAFADDRQLSRLPKFFWDASRSSNEEWLQQFQSRLQHSLGRMNHHIHPLVNPEDDPTKGERRSLQSCRPKMKKGKKTDGQYCKSGFPLENELTENPLIVCECIAHSRNLPVRGPRSMLGDVLPARNDAWLNAGPRALIAFTADNADVKFPFRVPIQEETHEVLLFDIKRHPNCGSRDPLDQALDMQAVMATIAGYFGGYTSKMQPIGERQIKQLREAIERRVAGNKSHGAAQDFKLYARRLVKDLELKGTIRTAVEGVNLSLHWNEPDILAAECIRTFPTVTFPATLLLKREEAETKKQGGVQKKELGITDETRVSVIAALHHGRGDLNRIYKEPPFDLLYGYRGNEQSVDVLSPYEMLLHYAMERILPPTNPLRRCHAEWTEEGKEYYKECSATKMKGHYKPGEHYTALPDEDRILMPNLQHLNGLRHCWCWQKRPRPHLPTWSFAKIPRSQFSPEENARLLSVYMRPWTLRESESTNNNPLLSLLGKCEKKEEEWQPRWKTATTKCAGSAQDAGTSPARKRRHIQLKPTEQEKCSFQVIT